MSKELPLPALILHLSRDQARLYERHVGMSQSRQMLLLELKQNGELSQAELVQRLGMEGTLVTRFVKQMEGSGLLTRRSDPHDNRFTLVTLTPAGEQIARQMADFTHMLEAQILEGLDEEMRVTIRQGLEQIYEKYEQLTAADPTA
ncbi:MarR family winged helix-turn-helix transcriptional regulator [Dictyobacter aurantiacus]|uniref:HTH marR-type domain-containing protein n=1 Tax=Dictyobacter aurantiacus TaxID=1936993 RepID=A0A401ZP24_9CHLR|nr:MarR family transcriptional regulator [Dictyobacter aurantiacus]GCE08544.1 hypothetical protein KDAU_58730 [Dictyobacter aurantiacus]